MQRRNKSKCFEEESAKYIPGEFIVWGDLHQKSSGVGENKKKRIDKTDERMIKILII